MALKILSPGLQPLGQFDGVDSELTSFKGGEVVTLTGVTYRGSDKAAKDVDDGYVGTTSKTRPAVTMTLPTSAATGPYWLCDDGTANYGTIFGSVVGGTVGLNVTGTQLGPHTATGSGKITCWDKPGVYGVTLDAVHTTAATGLVPTNSTLTVGAALYASPGGLLTPHSGTGTANGGAVMGRFISFETDGSLVKTPNNLAAALNNPASDVLQEQQLAFTMAVFSFKGE